MSRAATALRLVRQAGGFVLRRKAPAAPPLRLWVDITSRCNLSCAACPQSDLTRAQRRDMSPRLLARLAEEAPALGCQVNLFHRGEPLLHPELPKWVARFQSGGNPVRLHSNATLFNRDRARALLEARPDLLTLSLDSLDPAAYASARRGAELGRTLEGVRILLKERRRLGGGPPRVALLMMGARDDGEAAQRNLEELMGLGLDRVLHRDPHNWGGARPGEAARPAGDGKQAVCTFPWYGLAVLSDGRVTPCPQDFFGAMALGQAEREPLAEIWRGAQLQALRRAHSGRALERYPVCAACDRITRPTFLGVPREHAANFFREMLSSNESRL